MSDWYDCHAEQYDRDEHGLPGEVAFYTVLARQSRPPVLELGCGTGRVTLAIARCGVPITGLDRSRAMLEVARGRTSAADPVRWVQADMRSFALPERFGLICIPFRSFLHLLTVDDQQAALRQCYRHLLPGGRLALNIFNPAIALRAATLSTAMDRCPRTSHARNTPAGTAVFGRSSFGMRIRLVTVEQMGGLLAAAGFLVEALWGWFDRRPFDDASSEQVWLARRPAADPDCQISARG